MPASIPSHPHSLESASSQSPLSSTNPCIGISEPQPGASRVPPQHQLLLLLLPVLCLGPLEHWEDPRLAMAGLQGFPEHSCH